MPFLSLLFVAVAAFVFVVVVGNGNVLVLPGLMWKILMEKPAVETGKHKKRTISISHKRCHNRPTSVLIFTLSVFLSNRLAPYKWEKVVRTVN